MSTRNSQIERLSVPKVGYIPMGLMAISELAQRTKKNHRVIKMVKQFRPQLLGVIDVSERDGKYYIMDGQHRYWAFREVIGEGWEDKEMQCRIFKGLNERQEANMFLSLNDKQPVPAFDKFEKAAFAGLEPASSIMKILNNLDIPLSRGKSIGAISSTQTLVQVFVKYGAVPLTQALNVAKQCWGETNNLDGVVIQGLALVFDRYPILTVERVQLKLDNITLKKLNGKAAVAKTQFAKSKAVSMACAIVDLINTGTGRGTRNKIPNWWQSE